MSNTLLKRKHLTAHGLETHLSRPVLEVLTLHKLSKGEYLCRQGGDLSHLFVLVDGRLQVDALNAGGNHVVFSFESPLAVIGDLELFSGQQVVCNVWALEDSLVLAAPITFIHEHGYDDPTFLRFLLRHLSNKVTALTNFQANALLPLEHRLAQYLLDKASNYGHSFKLENREALAGLLNTSVRHLNRTLRGLEASGTIRLHTKTVTMIHPHQLTASLENITKKKT
jgi:CRP/FNR family transcriptional regulator, putaive post-exponential-phase nitrogen-starvation regulator